MIFQQILYRTCQDFCEIMHRFSTGEQFFISDGVNLFSDIILEVKIKIYRV